MINPVAIIYDNRSLLCQLGRGESQFPNALTLIQVRLLTAKITDKALTEPSARQFHQSPQLIPVPTETVDSP